MQPVDVLRPLALGQLALGPRKIEVEPGVESFLRRRHRTVVRRRLGRSLYDLAVVDARARVVLAQPLDPLLDRRVRREQPCDALAALSGLTM